MADLVEFSTCWFEDEVILKIERNHFENIVGKMNALKMQTVCLTRKRICRVIFLLLIIDRGAS